MPHLCVVTYRCSAVRRGGIKPSSLSETLRGSDRRYLTDRSTALSALIPPHLGHITSRTQRWKRESMRGGGHPLPDFTSPSTPLPPAGSNSATAEPYHPIRRSRRLCNLGLIRSILGDQLVSVGSRRSRRRRIWTPATETH